ncbi:hypothetical protein Tco_0429267 [Tanacetum coccineum]
MVACLERTDGNAEFHQIVDFLTTSSIHYALTISPTIYASYIEQFWATAKSKTVNDVKQIHATVDDKIVVILESSVRSDLHFDDEDGITCLSNDEIFVNLALMGYERVSTKLTFQKAFFSPQWKYLIHTILHCLSSKSTAWNEFSTNLASAVICLAKGQKFNFSKLIFDEPFNDVYPTPAHTKKIFTNMKRQNKDFSGRVTLLFASMLAPLVVGVEDGSEGFHQIVDFLNASHIRFVLSENPTIYDSFIKQFWQNATTPVADEVAFTSVNVVHEGAATNVSSIDVGQGSGNIPKSPTGCPMIHLSQDVIKKVKKLAADCQDRQVVGELQASGNITKTRSTAMSNDPLCQEIGSGDRPRCQEAKGGVIAQTRSKRASKYSYDSPLPGVNTSESDEERIEQHDLMDFVPPTPHDSPLSGGHTPGSDEGRPNINELMAICTNLSNRVLALEQSKTAQDLVINKLQKKVKRLEKALREITPGMKLFKIGTSMRKNLDNENVSKQGRKLKKRPTMFKEGDFDDFDDNVEGDAVKIVDEVNTATTGVSIASTPVTTAGVAISTVEPRTPPTTTTTAFEDEDLTIA